MDLYFSRGSGITVGCHGNVPGRNRIPAIPALSEQELRDTHGCGSGVDVGSRATGISGSADRDRWKRRSEHLKQQLDAARRAGFRQAAPFAKDRPQGRGGRPGRRAGAHYGRQSVPPASGLQVDETCRAPAPAACPDCGGAVELSRVATQYQEDLPVVRPIVRIASTSRSATARSVGGVQRAATGCKPPTRWERPACNWVPKSSRWFVRLHTHLGVPLAKVTHLLRTQFGLTVTPGGLAQVLHRAARQAAPTYTALCQQVRESPVVTPDGNRLARRRHAPLAVGLRPQPARRRSTRFAPDRG